MRPISVVNRYTLPPNISRGTQFVRIIVGLRQVEFSAHKDLLCAASEVLRARFLEEEALEVTLRQYEPDVFEVFCHWLYNSVDNIHHEYRSVVRSLAHWDRNIFWLRVYEMAECLVIPGLQIHAYDEIAEAFTSSSPTMTTRDFLAALFNIRSQFALQQYIIEHVAYWLEQTTDKDQWGDLFTSHQEFAAEMALAIIRTQMTQGPYPHPFRNRPFELAHGFRRKWLLECARSADEDLPWKSEEDKIGMKDNQSFVVVSEQG